MVRKSLITRTFLFMLPDISRHVRRNNGHTGGGLMKQIHEKKEIKLKCILTISFVLYSINFKTYIKNILKVMMMVIVKSTTYLRLNVYFEACDPSGTFSRRKN